MTHGYMPAVYGSRLMFAPHMDGERLRVGRRVVVNEWERLVVLRRGVITDTLSAGPHRIWRRGVRARRVDIRPFLVPVPTQEVPTADGVTVKVTASLQLRIVAPDVYVRATQSPIELVYLLVQVAVREVLAVTTVEALLANRGELTAQLAQALPDTADVGLEVMRLEIKDVVLPGELKRAQAEVLVARAQGQAALERARGESAALRSLANAARLAAEHPALVQLRLIQQLSASTGNTVVFGTPDVPARS